MAESAAQVSYVSPGRAHDVAEPVVRNERAAHRQQRSVAKDKKPNVPVRLMKSTRHFHPQLRPLFLAEPRYAANDDRFFRYSEFFSQRSAVGAGKILELDAIVHDAKASLSSPSQRA